MRLASGGTRQSACSAFLKNLANDKRRQSACSAIFLPNFKFGRNIAEHALCLLAVA